MSKRAKIWYGIFLISFVPYMYLAFVSIFGMEYTWFFSTVQSYGYDAVLTALLFGSLIPVYPTILLFQCVYGLVNRKKLPAKQKRIVGILALSLVGVTVLGCVGHFVREKLTIQKNYERDVVVIKEYLKESFGEEIAADMEIGVPNEITSCYNVSSPLLEYSFEAWMDEEGTRVTNCGFEADYIKEMKLNQKMGAYVSKQWNLPEGAQIDVVVEDIEVKGHRIEELPQSLFPTCEYRINGMTIQCDIYDETKVVNAIEQFLLQAKTKEGSVCRETSFKFYVRVKDAYYASILALCSNEEGIWTLHFSGYTDATGTTIEETKVELKIPS